MGKKRKAQSRQTRTNGIVSHNDTFDNSEDEFVKGREKILLDEGPAAKRQRRQEEEDAELMPSDEEVFGDANVSGEDEEDEAEEDLIAEDVEEAADEDEEDERYWGANRADYYGADVIEEEQDALDEEAEARRLQQKQLQGMTEADFGFDEIQWAQTEPSKKGTVEKLPPVRIPDTATDEERLQILNTRYPEFEPLSADLLACHEEYEDLKAAVADRNKAGKDTEASPLQTRFWAVSAYMAAIAMYMAVLTSTKDGIALPPAELRQHPIMTTLLRAREAWENSKNLESDDDSDIEGDDTGVVVEQPVQDTKKSSKAKVNHTLAANDIAPEKQKEKKAKNPKSSNSPELMLADVRPLKTASSKPKAPKRATLESILAQANPSANESDSDFGDETPLTASEAAAKLSKKKSLRFYTSQIASKSNKRASASRHAGGDDDLPYKERIRDREERLQREAAREQLNADAPAPGGDDNDAEYDANDLSTASALNAASNEYYNTITSATTAKKASKLARAEAHALAAQQGAQVFEEETVGADGKRKITYAIEKNKGLQPRRKKDVRNPRVKKKKKYEEKKKKLASMRPVWKGGLKGAYAGEQTGIKANLVKSVKL